MLPEEDKSQAYWYHLDGRGSVAGLTKHQGPVGAGSRLPLPLRRLRPGAPGPGQLDRPAQLPSNGRGVRAQAWQPALHLPLILKVTVTSEVTVTL